MNCINHPDREKVAFCQECGRPLCAECIRRVNGSVFCEADLAARLNAVPGGAAGAAAIPPAAAGANPFDGPLEDGLPKPGLAALLGFIPGVGAMYNGQLVKGLIHIAVFAVLVSLADDHGIFGFFVAGWVCYMVIEAYQTAMARRNGTPLPNAFGLNDLGDRLTQKMGGVAPAASVQDPTYVYTPPAAAGQQAAGANPYADASAYVPTGANPYAAGANPYASATTAQSYAAAANNYAYPPPPPAVDPGYMPPPTSSWCAPGGMPVGAVWMIVLGVFFFLGTTHMFPFFRGAVFWPLVIIAFGVYQFYKHAQYLPPNDGSPQYRYGLLYAARRAWWIVAVGVLLFLDATHILRFHYSWPFFLIFAGVWMFLERSLSPHVGGPYVAPPAAAGAGAVVTPPPAETGTSVVPPTYVHSENAGNEGEGR